MAEGNVELAVEKLRSSNCLPGSTARVCPHAELCEGSCVLARAGRDPSPLE